MLGMDAVLVEVGNRIDFTPEEALAVFKQYGPAMKAALGWREGYVQIDNGKPVVRKEAAYIPIPPIRTLGAKVMAETIEQMKKGLHQSQMHRKL